MDTCDDVKFWVGYNSRGEAVTAKPEEGVKMGKIDSPLKVAHLAESGYENVEIKTTQILRVYSNPGCCYVVGGVTYYFC
jgi:hypothetical protein